MILPKSTILETYIFYILSAVCWIRLGDLVQVNNISVKVHRKYLDKALLVVE